MRGPKGLTPTQVRDDPSSRLIELEEDEEIKADIPTNIYIHIILTLCPSRYPPGTGWEKIANISF